MSFDIACSHCGKSYTVAETMAGRTVRCKACGQVFIIAAPESKPLPAAQPWASTIKAPVPEETVPVAGGALDGFIGALSLFRANGWVLLVCVPIAAGAGLMGRTMPAAWYGALIGFPILGILFMAVGLLVFILRTAQSQEEMKSVARDFWPGIRRGLIVGVSGILGGALGGGLSGVLVRAVWGPKDASALQGRRPLSHYNKGATHGFWALAIVLLPLLTFAVTLWANAFPHEAPTHRAKQARHLPAYVPLLTPAASSEPPASDSPAMRKSEQNLRRIASAVFTYRDNLHKTPENLADLFRYDPQDLRSPFGVASPVGYVYVPANVTEHRDGRIVAYDGAELDAMGFTQAITQGFGVIELSRDQLFARADVPR